MTNHLPFDLLVFRWSQQNEWIQNAETALLRALTCKLIIKVILTSVAMHCRANLSALVTKGLQPRNLLCTFFIIMKGWEEQKINGNKMNWKWNSRFKKERKKTRRKRENRYSIRSSLPEAIPLDLNRKRNAFVNSVKLTLIDNFNEFLSRVFKKNVRVCFLC